MSDQPQRGERLGGRGARLAPWRRVARRGVRPRDVVAGLLAYLTLMAAAIVTVDILALGPWQDMLVRHRDPTPAFWWELNREGAVTEWLQWLCLAAAAVVAGALAGRLSVSSSPAARRLTWFFAIWAAALALMLIEDAGNPRHELRQYAHFIGPDASKGVELACYLLLAAIPMSAVLWFFHDWWRLKEGRRYLLAGLTAYAVAGTTSAFRHWGDWYMRTGEWVHARMGPAAQQVSPDGRSVGFWLMDTVGEEPIELIGAAMLLAAMLAFLHACRTGTTAEAGAGDRGAMDAAERG